MSGTNEYADFIRRTTNFLSIEHDLSLEITKMVMAHAHLSTLLVALSCPARDGRVVLDGKHYDNLIFLMAELSQTSANAVQISEDKYLRVFRQAMRAFGAYFDGVTHADAKG